MNHTDTKTLINYVSVVFGVAKFYSVKVTMLSILQHVAFSHSDLCRAYYER